MPDLTTRYLSKDLKNPLVASPSPLCQDAGNVRRMEDNGIAAVVLHSLFEEQITLESHELDQHLSHGAESFPEALTYFPEMEDYNLGPDAYLEYLGRCKDAVDIPIIGSLNGISSGGWIEYAKLIEEAGADALELNIYFIPTDPGVSGAEVEKMYLELVRDVAQSVKIPVAVKVSPYFSAMAHFAKELDNAGAAGLVIFNRFYQPDLDIEDLVVQPDLELSTSSELRLRLRWLAILYDHVDMDLALTGGVHTTVDMLKGLMAGASVTMTTSALLQNGIEYAGNLLDELTRWMDEHEYESVRQMRGSMSQRSVAEPAAFERANYMRVLSSYTPNGTGGNPASAFRSQRPSRP